MGFQKWDFVENYGLTGKKGWLKSLPLKHDLAFMNSHIRDCAIRLLAYCKVTNSDWKRQFFFLTIFFFCKKSNPRSQETFANLFDSFTIIVLQRDRTAMFIIYYHCLQMAVVYNVAQSPLRSLFC